MRYVLNVIAVAFVAGSLSVAQAADYPDRPITILVPGATGGVTDAFARVYKESLAAELKAPVVILNRGSGALTIALEATAVANPDGYTLLFAGSDAMNLVPLTLKSIPFDPATAFTPIAKVGGVDVVMAVNPAVPANTIQDLVALVKAKPGSIRFGTGAVGSLPHVAIEWLKQKEGLTMEHIAYRGGGAAAAAGLSGEVEMIGSAAPTVTRVGEGKLRPLVVTGPKRLPSVPNVPTMQESGYPDMIATAWFGLFGPAKLPADIAARLIEATRRAVATDEFRKRALGIGSEDAGFLAGAEFGRYVAEDRERWRAVVAKAGIAF